VKITIEIKQDAQGYQIDARWGSGDGGTRFAPDLAGAEEKAHEFLTRAIKSQATWITSDLPSIGAVIKLETMDGVVTIGRVTATRGRVIELDENREFGHESLPCWREDYQRWTMWRSYITPVQSLSTHKQRTLELTYGQLVALLGEPNTTELENCSKITASWAFRDDRGRTGFVWAYEADPVTCTSWSASELGAGGLLSDLFGAEK